jgi:hypothetical protein
VSSSAKANSELGDLGIRFCREVLAADGGQTVSATRGRWLA